MSDINQAKKLLLADYERERDELTLVIAKLRRDLRMDSEDGPADVEPPAVQAANGSASKLEDVVKPGDFYGMSQIGAVKAFLERRGKRNTASLQEIAQALLRGKATEAAMDDKDIRNLSSNLSKNADFQSIAKGRWGLSEWYPGTEKTPLPIP